MNGIEERSSSHVVGKRENTTVDRFFRQMRLQRSIGVALCWPTLDRDEGFVEICSKVQEPREWEFPMAINSATVAIEGRTLKCRLEIKRLNLLCNGRHNDYVGL